MGKFAGDTLEKFTGDALEKFTGDRGRFINFSSLTVRRCVIS